MYRYASFIINIIKKYSSHETIRKYAEVGDNLRTVVLMAGGDSRVFRVREANRGSPLIAYTVKNGAAFDTTRGCRRCDDG